MRPSFDSGILPSSLGMVDCFLAEPLVAPPRGLWRENFVFPRTDEQPVLEFFDSRKRMQDIDDVSVSLSTSVVLIEGKRKTCGLGRELSLSVLLILDFYKM